jgi:SAM-dependent methyltransferase
MTPEMVTLTRANARKLSATNVEFRLGEIEHLPVADGTIDVILSNCVINLSPEKQAVFDEAFRVLCVGGRLAISDVVAIAPIPDELRTQAAAIGGCIAGAALLDDVKRMLSEAGFKSIDVKVARSAEIVDSCAPRRREARESQRRLLPTWLLPMNTLALTERKLEDLTDQISHTKVFKGVSHALPACAQAAGARGASTVWRLRGSARACWSLRARAPRRWQAKGRGEAAVAQARGRMGARTVNSPSAESRAAARTCADALVRERNHGGAPNGEP